MQLPSSSPQQLTYGEAVDSDAESDPNVPGLVRSEDGDSSETSESVPSEATTEPLTQVVDTRLRARYAVKQAAPTANMRQLKLTAKPLAVKPLQAKERLLPAEQLINNSPEPNRQHSPIHNAEKEKKKTGGRSKREAPLPECAPSQYQAQGPANRRSSLQQHE